MTAQALNLLDTSHILTFIFCVFVIVFLPRLFIGSSEKTIKILRYILAFLMISHEIFDPFFKVEVRNYAMVDALPLHMCAFSTWCISIYLLGGPRIFFLFAYFWGIVGAGMSLLTPYTALGFPSLEYLNHMYGHLLIILGVSVAMVLMDQRPYFKDFLKIMTYTTFVFLPLMYVLNFALETNYWYILEKPSGDNITSFMPDAPYHIFALIPAAWFFTYLVYVPYHLKDRRAN